jgi:LPXTG-motif cell wall-anchored protein
LKVEVASGSIGMGTVTGSGKYKEGTDVLIKAIPNSGYAFVNWSIQYVHPEPSILEETSKMPMPDYTNPELMIHIGRCNIVATANFEPIPTHEVHLFVTPDGSGTAMFQGEDQSGIYMEGEDFTLIATPKPGFEFLYWSWEYCEHEGPEIGRAMATDLNLLVVIDPELTNPILTKEMGEMDMCFTAHFRPLSLVNVHYLDGMSVPLAPPVFLDGPIGSPYVTTAKVIEGYELTATPENATGFFGLEPIDVNYFYRPVETTEPSTEPSTEPTTAPSTEPTTAPTTAATTEDDTPTEPATIPTTASATTTAIETTEIITTEAVPLGAPELVNFDAIVEDSTLPPTEEIVEEVTEEVIPLADALPQTGQFPADLFYGIGGLISGLGVWLKRKK